MTETEDLREQLRAALKSRAMLYAAIHDEIAAELGPERATAILKRAIHARGAAAGKRFLGRHAPADFAGLRDSFLDFLPDHGGLFDVEVTRCDAGGLDIAFHTCPIKQAWQDAGFTEERIAALCDVAGSVDVGTFEAAGFAVVNDTYKAGGQGCCRLRISRKD